MLLVHCTGRKPLNCCFLLLKSTPSSSGGEQVCRQTAHRVAESLGRVGRGVEMPGLVKTEDPDERDLEKQIEAGSSYGLHLTILHVSQFRRPTDYVVAPACRL